MRTINKAELDEIVYKHNLWLMCKPNGVRADLRNVDLSGADLRNINLRNANLEYINLSNTDLRCANLSGADFYAAYIDGANLRHSDLRCANLRHTRLIGADLSYANLRNADLEHADLRYADFSNANLSSADLGYTNIYRVKNIFFPMTCPEKGSFIAFKKAGDYIIELFVPEDAKRSSATTRKCRCNKAKVISITTLSGNETNITGVYSDYDSDFIYKLGEYIEVKDFDDNRWNECSTGIHFFISRQEAVNY